MTTSTQSPMKEGISRPVRPRTIGRFPVRSERIDFTTPCRKCENAPTCVVKLGPVATERTCPTCGDVEFFDVQVIKHNGVSHHGPDGDPEPMISTGAALAA